MSEKRLLFNHRLLLARLDYSVARNRKCISLDQ